MAVIYLVKSASFNKNEVFYKVGYTSNLFKRLIPYMVHNPSFQLIQTATVYKKTKRGLENEIHKEIENLGFKFHKHQFFGMKTEWFAVNTNSKFYENIKMNGLQVFKSCKNRKSLINYEGWQQPSFFCYFSNVNKLWTPIGSKHPEFNYEQTVNNFIINCERINEKRQIPKCKQIVNKHKNLLTFGCGCAIIVL